MKAKTLIATSTAELARAFAAATADGFAPTLAVVFMSIKQDRDAVCRLLDEKGISIFGATTAGEFVDGDISELSTAVMLLEIDRAHFRVFFEETLGRTTHDIAYKIGQAGLAAFAQPAFIVASGGISTDGEVIVRAVEEAAGSAVTIFGGMAGDDFTMTGTYVFTNGRSTNNGLVMIALDGSKVQVSSLATSGWKPVGTVRTITKSVGNVVYTIDDLPALDVVMKYMGVSNKIDEWKDVIGNIGSEFPMQLQRTDGPPVMRAPLFANKLDRSLVCAGTVPQGSKVRFSLPPDFDVIDQVVDECGALKDQQPAAEAMIMFSCKARHLTLGPLVGTEINRVKEVWGSPLVGFFSYGEIGRTNKGKHEFHNNTCCILVLNEK